MQEYKNKTSKDKPLEVTETSYCVIICKNIVQLSDGTWQFDRYDYNLNEYAVIKQKEKDDLLVEIARQKEEITNLKTENQSLTERIFVSESAIDSILLDILPTIQ